MLFPDYHLHRNRHDYVFILKDRSGGKRTEYCAVEAGYLLSSERMSYTLHGIFPNLAKHRLQRPFSPEQPKQSYEFLGVPEGKHLAKWKRDGSNVEFLKVEDYPGYNFHREQFQSRMKKILKKAKELQAMGIDRKTAFSAARKCECNS
jgi:hypothetical protein